MVTVSIVIPALNEQENIEQTIRSIPVERLRAAGAGVEILVVDNGSTDLTAPFARGLGATVVVQPVRGYGNAYRAGFAYCRGDIIATGDADLTYPFEILPDALALLDAERLDFLSMNRLTTTVPGAMSRSHLAANLMLTSLSRVLFGLPFADSQSGMWVFRRHVWSHSRVLATGMAFSQELKVAAYRNGFRCGEMAIEYRARGGRRKLRPVRDGVTNVARLFALRMRTTTANQPPAGAFARRGQPTNAGHFAPLPATPFGAQAGSSGRIPANEGSA